MSKLRATLELAVPRDQAAAACRRAVVELGWSVLEDRQDTLVAREDAARLHCHCPPATAAVRVHSQGASSTVVEMETKVPGFGPISAGHAEEQSKVLARRIGLLVAGDDGQPSAVRF